MHKQAQVERDKQEINLTEMETEENGWEMHGKHCEVHKLTKGRDKQDITHNTKGNIQGND